MAVKELDDFDSYTFCWICPQMMKLIILRLTSNNIMQSSYRDPVISLGARLHLPGPLPAGLQVACRRGEVPHGGGGEGEGAAGRLEALRQHRRQARRGAGLPRPRRPPGERYKEGGGSAGHEVRRNTCQNLCYLKVLFESILNL